MRMAIGIAPKTSSSVTNDQTDHTDVMSPAVTSGRTEQVPVPAVSG